MSTAPSGREYELAARFLALPKERRARLFEKLQAQGIDLGVLPIPPTPPGPERERLSYAQERLWFLAQLEPDSTAYNMAGSLRLRGAVDRAALSDALGAIVERQAALRTTFETVDGRARARVHAAQPVDVTCIDARAEFASAGEACVRAWAEREADVVFDLEHGPLVRISLVQFAAADHGLFVCLHHIVADGWSLRVFIDEFTQHYAARVAGEALELPPLKIQYADYAAWQRSWLEAGELQRQLAYWRERLAGERGVLPLPLDRPRPAEQSHRGALVELTLSVEHAQAIRQLARTQGVTLFVLGLAAWKTLLHRVTGRSDVCVGSSIANRNRIETEPLIGFFVNTQVLRSFPEREQAFSDFLAAVKRGALEAQTHQELPFEQLVEALQPERNLGHNPLFHVHYDHQQRAYGAMRALPGLEAEPIAREQRSTLFDLMLTTTEQADGTLSVQLAYATDLFDHVTVELLAARFVRVLSEAVLAPDTALERLELATATERAALPNQPPVWSADATTQEWLAAHTQQQPLRGYVLDRELRAVPAGLVGDLYSISAQAPVELTPAELSAQDRLIRTGELARRRRDGTLEVLGATPAVEARADDDPAPSGPLAPHSEIEAELCEIWQDVLQVPHVAATDNFFELGGDSIVSIQVVSRARARGIALRPKDLFHHKTVQKLARVARRESDRAASAADSGEVPLSPIQAAFFARALAAPDHFNQSVLLECTSPLDLAALERALATLIEQHAGLRTSFRQTDGVWVQSVAAPTDGGSRRVLRVAPWSDRSEIEALCDAAQRSLDLRRGELMRALYLRLPDGGSLLLLVVHHLVIDGVSWRVLLEDLQRAYLDGLHGQHGQPGRTPELPARTSSFAAWSERLRSYAQSPELAAESAYWQRVAAQIPELPCDVEPVPDAISVGQAERIAVRLDRTATERLLKHSAAAYRTRIHELLLAALSRALCDSFEQPAVAVQLEGHGREDLFDGLDVSRTLGWFTTEYPVVLTPRQSVGETIQAVKETLRSVPAHGIGHGVLSWLGPDALRAQLAAAKQPRVTFNYLGQFDSSFGSDSLFRVSTERSGAEVAESTPLHNWLEINGQVYAGELSLWIGWRPEMYRRETVERLAARFEAALADVIAHCTTPGAGALTPSDFPLAKLDPEQLAALQRAGEALEDVYPVTPMQHGMLFHALYDQEPGVYVTQLAVTIEGLSPERFATAWQRALERHPILRTSFAWEGLLEPVQRVSASVPLALERFDLSGLPDQPAQLERIVREQHRRGFDLERAPLWRVALVRLDGQRQHFVWTVHHLLLDGWSTARLLDEVLLDYLGRPSPAPAAAFGDYVAWLQRRDRSASEGFWRELLRGVSEPSLLAGHLMGATLAGDARDATGVQLVRTRLSVDETRALSTLAQRQHVTLNTLIQAAWSILLARYTGQARVVFGGTTSGRPAELVGSEQMLGLFINTLPVVADVQPEAALDELWQSLQQRGLEAREHEYAPLADIQRWAGHGRSDLFDSLIVVESFPIDRALEADWQTLSFGRVQATEITNYALTLGVRPGAELEIDYGFDPARVAPSAVDRLAAQLLGLLRDFTSLSPLTRTAELTLRGSRAEQVPTAASLAEPFVPMHAAILRRLQLRAAAHEAVVVGAGERWTAAELIEQAARVAERLRDLGVGPEARVGLHVERGPWLIAGALGVWQAGAAYVPLDPSYPRERLQWMVEDAGVELVLADPSFQPFDGVRTLAVSELDALQPRAAEAWPEVLPTHLAYVIYTSGSTGTPRGVGVAHGALSMHARAVAAIYRNDETDCALTLASASFDAAVEQWVVPLSSGARLVVSDAEAWTASETLEALRRDRVTVIYPPTSQILALSEWLEQIGEAYPLRVVCVGGEAVARESVALIRRSLRPEMLINGYGPTETVVTPLLWRATPDMACESAYAPIGWIVGDRSGYVLDPELNVQPRGVAGELYLGGSGMARGYLGRPALTAERFVPDPFSALPGARLYRTGDRVRALEDGTIEYLGRVDQQVKLRGHRIELGEIEARLLALPGVSEAVVILRTDAATPRLVGYVGASEEADEPELLLLQLRAALPEYLIPAQLVVLSRLPRTANGKIDRSALPAPELPRREFRTARTDLERELLGYFEQVLTEDGLGIDDDFFERGGDSLSSLQLVSRLRAAGHALTLKDVFALRNVAALADALAGGSLSAAQLPAIERRTAGEGPHALSYAQERLWFLAQLEPDSPAYNISGALHLRGALEPSLVQRAFDELALRHPALRTSFEASDGHGVARVRDALSVPLRRIDVRGAAAAVTLERARALFAEDGARTFALDQAPLVRVSLIQLADAEHVLVVTLHHLIADGWSMRLLIDQFAQLYATLSRAETPVWREPAVQYLDYAAWQRDWLEAGEGARQLGYWRAQLGEEHPVLTLQSDRPRPALSSYRGGGSGFELDAATSAGVLALARARGASVFSVLLAAFESVLYRLTGQRDLRVGVPFGNRNRVETEDVVGLFVNTLVLRTELDGSLSFEQLLARVQETSLGAQIHQDLPFERLVEALQPERSLSHNPLFQVMYDHQRAGLDALRALPGLQVEAFEAAARTTQFDLTLTTAEDAGRIHGDFTFATDLFDQATVERISERFRRVLRQVVDNPGLRLSELEFLSEAERAALEQAALPRSLYTWTEPVFVHAAIAAQARLRPQAIALESEQAEEPWTYERLEHVSNRWAQRLRKLGVGPEVKVGLCVGRSPRMVVGALAILKAGGAYVPLDPSYPLERLRTIVADAQVQLIVGERQLPMAAELGGQRCVWLDHDSVDAESLVAPEVALAGDNLAYVVYTSGSTGRPKGVGVSHAALAQHVAAIGADYGMTPDDCSLHFASMSFDAGVEQWVSPLVHGARLFIRGDELWSAERAVEVLRERRVSWFEMPPGYLREVAQAALDRAEVLALRACSAGGEAVSRESLGVILRAIAPAPLVNGYGPTETVITPMTWHARDASDCTTAYVPIGRVVGARRGYVLDADLELVPVGVTGELYLGGSSLARGYVEQPGLTAERFVPDPYGREPGGRMYRTGDLARVAADGSVEYLGRADQQIKIRGFRVELGEIESQLLAQPGVREAVVVAQGGAVASRLLGYVAGEVDAEQLRLQLRAALPEYLVPAQLLVLRELPKNSNGKIDRKQLPEPDALMQAHVAPRTELERQLCEIFGEVLVVDDVGVTDNFFALGGDSIRSLQVISRARTVGLVLQPRDLFERQTPAELALAAARETAAAGASTTRISALPRTADTYALSFAQERLWFLAQLEPTSAAYNIAAAVRVRGLYPARLMLAVDALVRRHEILRTTFEAQQGEPRQRVHAPDALRVEVQVHDLRGAHGEDRARTFVEAQAHTPFDLERGPLVRVAVLQLSDGEHVLSLVMHHLISDGWSLDLAIRELSALYAGETLEPLALQYVDYAAWQRDWLSGSELAQQLAYWRSQLGDEHPILELPADRPRPAVQTHRGAVLARELDPELAERLHALARGEGVTLYMLLLAAWQTLLYRLTGQRDIRVGVPVTNRSRLETEALIGMFVNTQVLRSEISGEQHFDALLQRVKRAALDASAHADLPFEQLVEALQPERSLGHNPLFQVTYNHASLTPQERDASLALELSEFSWEQRGTQFDLSLDTEELAGRRLRISLTYATDLFEPATIDALAVRFEQLLVQLAARPRQRIAELELLTAGELDALAAARVRRSQTDSQPNAWVQRRFEEVARQQPDAVALECGAERWSFQQLDAAASRWAHRLRRLGVGAEVRVGVCVTRSARALLAPLAIWRAGGVYVPLDPDLPPERLVALARDARLALVLTESALGLGAIASGDSLIRLELDREDVSAEAVVAPEFPSSGHELAYVLYTSGSTGKPKGVAVSHAALAMHAAAIGADYELSATDCALQFASTSFDTGLEQWLVPLLHGARVVLRGDELWSLEDCATELRARGVTRLDLPPGYLHELASLLALRGETLPLRSVISGGEALPSEHVATIREAFAPAALINAYGPTEALITPLTWHADSVSDSTSPFAPIGSAIGDRECYVLDVDLQRVAPGSVGELYIGGSGLARGYLDQAARTAERFVPDPFCHLPGARMYRTGDRVRSLRDGALEFLGRLDDQVKIRGYRIELGEVEAQLRAQPGVRDAAVVAIADPAGSSRLVGYVVGRDDVADLLQKLREFLPEYTLPSQLVALAALPRTAAGKLDRARLPAPERPETTFVAPRNPLEVTLAQIWQEVLGVARVSLRDNFFELGGHSLLVMKVVSRVRSELAVDLGVRQLFETRDLAELGEIVARAQAESAALDETVASALSELEGLSGEELARLLEDDDDPADP